MRAYSFALIGFVILVTGCASNTPRNRTPELFVAEQEAVEYSLAQNTNRAADPIKQVIIEEGPLVYRDEDVPLNVYAIGGGGKPADLEISVRPDVLLRKKSDDGKTDVVVRENIGNRATLYLDVDEIQGLPSVEVIAVNLEGLKHPLEEAIAKGLADKRTVELKKLPKELHSTLSIWPDSEAAKVFGDYFASAFYVCDVNFINDSGQDMLLNGTSLRAEVTYRLAKEDTPPEVLEIARESNLGALSVAEFGVLDDSRIVELRRPMTYTDVLRAFEHERESDMAQQAIRWLQFAGTLAAGAGVFVTGVDYPTGVAFYNGIFLPELEKRLLWDIIMHLDNLVSRGLKEIEELPRHSQKNRVVFFPRGAIYGLHEDTTAMYIAKLNRQATAQVENMLKLGNTPEEARKALLGMIASEVGSPRGNVADMQVYKDAIATLANAREAQAKAKQEEDEAKNADKVRREKLKLDLANILGAIALNPDKNVSQELVKAIQDYLDALKQADEGNGGEGG